MIQCKFQGKKEALKAQGGMAKRKEDLRCPESMKASGRLDWRIASYATGQHFGEVEEKSGMKKSN